MALPVHAGWAVLASLVLGIVWSTRLRPRSMATVMPAWLAALSFAAVALASLTAPDVRAGTMALSNYQMLGEAWGWIDQNLHGARIAYVGNNVPYFLCGRRLENRVFYVPARKPVDGRFHDFAMLPETRALGPPDTSEPACDRYIMDPREWLANLRALRVDYVFVAAFFLGVQPRYRHDAEDFPIEREWLDALRQAAPGSQPIAKCHVFAPNTVRLYKLNLDAPPALGVQLRRVVQDETDALARLRQDQTPAGQPIRDYPLARQVIDAAGLRPLDTMPSHR